MAREWADKNLPDMTGRVAAVTGADKGIGFEVALQFALHNAKVFLLCRDEAKAKRARHRIYAEGAREGSVDVVHCDMDDLASVRRAADELHRRTQSLHVLVNNAGLMALKDRELTKDGLEKQWAVSVAGHWLLTALLMDLLERSSGRVVFQSSNVAQLARGIAFDDLGREKKYSPFGVYGEAKLASLLAVHKLTELAQKKGRPVTFVASHPGYTNTDLLNGTWMERFGGYFAQSPEMGALTELMAATDPTIKSNEYVGPALNLWGPPSPNAFRSRTSLDSRLADRLADTLDKQTGVRMAEKV